MILSCNIKLKQYINGDVTIFLLKTPRILQSIMSDTRIRPQTKNGREVDRKTTQINKILQIQIYLNIIIP